MVIYLFIDLLSIYLLDLRWSMIAEGTVLASWRDALCNDASQPQIYFFFFRLSFSRFFPFFPVFPFFPLCIVSPLPIFFMYFFFILPT